MQPVLAGAQQGCNFRAIKSAHPMNILGPTSDLVVIGGGAFGMWTALSAAERGARVTLIDQNAIGHPRGSSGGASRNIRAAYGTDVFYTRLAIVAWSAWQLREIGRASCRERV